MTSQNRHRTLGPLGEDRKILIDLLDSIDAKLLQLVVHLGREAQRRKDGFRKRKEETS